MEFKVLINRFKTRKVGFRFDMYAWLLVCEANGIEPHQLGNLAQDKLVSDLVYSAYVSYCTRERKKVKYNIDQLSDIMDKMTKSQSDQMAEEILRSKVFGKPISDWSEDKKKAK